MSRVEEERGGGADGRSHPGAGLARLLLAGLLIAIALMLAGAVLAAVEGSGSVHRASSITNLPHLLVSGDPTGFLDLGLLVLLAIPFVRVIALGVDFARRGQWLFAGISGLVAALLALGTVLGITFA